MRHYNRSWSRFALVALLVLAIPFPAAAEPPPWAPAHGWRKKHDPYYVGYTGKRWEKDYGVLTGRCNTQAVGAVVGGAIGGAVGARAGDGPNRAVATVVGTVIGAAIGARIGRDIDDNDLACMGHTLELAKERKTVSWNNPRTGVSYQLTPLQNTDARGMPCRQFTTQASAKGKNETLRGTACRKDDGRWEIYR